MTQLVHTTFWPKFAAQAPGAQFGAQLAQWANSAAPDAASLSNTVPSYATLGGLFRYAPVAGAATDYALFGYPVPSTHRFILKSVAVSLAVGTAIGATADVNIWGLGINATAASLATTDSGSTYGPRRIALGQQAFAASAAAGTQAPDLRREFVAPLVIEPSRYVHLILRRTNGTTTGELLGTATFDGYFERVGEITAGL